jgi:hypothetical protein
MLPRCYRTLERAAASRRLRATDAGEYIEMDTKPMLTVADALSHLLKVYE